MPSNWPAVIYNSNLTYSCAQRVAAARWIHPPFWCARSRCTRWANGSTRGMLAAHARFATDKKTLSRGVRHQFFLARNLCGVAAALQAFIRADRYNFAIELQSRPAGVNRSAATLRLKGSKPHLNQRFDAPRSTDN